MLCTSPEKYFSCCLIHQSSKPATEDRQIFQAWFILSEAISSVTNHLFIFTSLNKISRRIWPMIYLDTKLRMSGLYFPHKWGRFPFFISMNFTEQSWILKHSEIFSSGLSPSSASSPGTWGCILNPILSYSDQYFILPVPVSAFCNMHGVAGALASEGWKKSHWVPQPSPCPE